MDGLRQHGIPGPEPLKVTGAQTIGTAGELHKTFTEYLDRAAAVVLDLADVHECDAAALQLIYALHRSAVQQNMGFRIAFVSTAVTEAATALGLPLERLTAG